MSACDTLTPQPAPSPSLVLDLVDAEGSPSEWAPSSFITVPRSSTFAADVTSGKDLLQSAISSKDAETRKSSADAFAKLVASSGILAFAQDSDFAKTLNGALSAPGKKENHVRAGGIDVFSAILEASGKSSETVLFPCFQNLLNLSGDKSKKTRETAASVAKAFVAIVDKNSSKKLSQFLYTKGTHLAVANQTRLEILNDWVQNTASKEIQFCLAEALPAVANDVHDSDKVTLKNARDCLKWLVATCSNPDIVPLIPDLCKGLENLGDIGDTVYSLASTTFIQNVDSCTLAIMSPILSAGLAQKNSPVTKRACARIVENMAKLVEEPRDLNNFVERLLPMMEKARDTVADPEVRKVCGQACATLIKKADVSRSMTNNIDTSVTLALLKSATSRCSKNVTAQDQVIIDSILVHVADILVMLNQAENFDDTEWQSAVGPYFKLLISDSDASTLVSTLRTTAMSVREKAPEEEEKFDAEELCRCDFSLAYGNKVLLKKTKLLLHRGFKYGLIGPNDCGKTSLMRAIAGNNIDGLPDPDELRCVFVETDVQGELSDLSVLDYIFADPLLKDCGVSRDEMAITLGGLGFNKDSPADITTMVGNLSGGWRMKLALARATLLKADILLLDEPTNHLDTYNVKWLQDYILGLTDVTCLIVTHDSKVLDTVCTNMIHFEDLKLENFRGNLTDFVVKYPEAKSYFELVSTKFSFKFPSPGKIPGVNSKGKAIMKMSNITFTYPGVAKPQLTGVSVQVALASRVGIVGVNGAGKSTMIRLLMGELEPNKGSGDIYKHPNARVGYIAQHAFHHIENHLDITCNEYIRWRYKTGDDREALVKVTALVNKAEITAQKAKVDIPVYDSESSEWIILKKTVIERVTNSRQKNRKKGEDEFECDIGNNKRVYIGRKFLCENGWGKTLTQIDERIALRETQFARPLTLNNVTQHMSDVGLEAEFSTHIKIGALSTGQKVKVVLGAALWNQPHILILDEPTNYLDRDSLGALAGAIREFDGGVIMISHNSQFVDTLCPQIWHLEGGTLNVKGDADWMREANKIKISDKDELPDGGEMLDKFGNTVKIKNAKKKLSKKEKKARARRRKNRLKNDLEPLSEDESTEEE